MNKTFFMLRASLIAVALIFAAQASAASKEVTVRGRLGRTVEAGGWLINTDAQKYLILNPQQFQRETWFREGTEVEATGETRPDAVTIYQEGVPFEVRSMKPQGASGEGDAARATDRAPDLTRVLVTGDAVVRSQPDTAILTLGVVTQNPSASEAQAENASRSDAVVRAVRAAAGADAEVKTSGYNLQPQFDYRNNQSPKIVGYVARNSVVITMSDLTKVGGVIDAASRAGANSVDGLAFTLRRDEQARSQALTEATREATRKARVLAEALGGRVVRILEVQEAGAYRPPIRAYDRAAGTAGRIAESAPPTPIEAGSLEIHAQVQLVAEVETRP